MPSKPPALPAARLPKPGKSKPSSAPAAARTPKSFQIKPWSSHNEGEKIVIYGRSGIGKTTLAAMAPGAVFIGLDDGGRKINNPLTGKPIQVVAGVESFADLRDALAQSALWPKKCTIVIDTITKCEELIQHYVLETTTVNGQRVQSFRKFGWDGDRYTLDQVRLLLTDLDTHVRAGRNVILLAQQGQVKVANAEGADYLEDGPAIQHRNDCSSREEIKQWADHVLRVGYLDLEVAVERAGKAGKVVSSDSTRAVFSAGAQHFTAKSRPLSSGEKLPPVVSFESEADSALWQFLFPAS